MATKKKPTKTEEKSVPTPPAPMGRVIGPGVVKRAKPAPGEAPLGGGPPPDYQPSEQVFRRKK